MPVVRTAEGSKPGFRYTGGGPVFTYNQGDEDDRAEARRKAYLFAANMNAHEDEDNDPDLTDNALQMPLLPKKLRDDPEGLDSDMVQVARADLETIQQLLGTYLGGDDAVGRQGGSADEAGADINGEEQDPNDPNSQFPDDDQSNADDMQGMDDTNQDPNQQDDEQDDSDADVEGQLADSTEQGADGSDPNSEGTPPAKKAMPGKKPNPFAKTKPGEQQPSTGADDETAGQNDAAGADEQQDPPLKKHRFVGVKTK